MSRIFDALRNAERMAKKMPPSAPGRGPGSEVLLERRRSQRAALSVPVLVYGHEPGNRPFYEQTRTLQVNASGGLLTLNRAVRQGQRLLLMSPQADAEIECRVVYLQPRAAGGMEVGVEFDGPAADFWPVRFPPER